MRTIKIMLTEGGSLPEKKTKDAANYDCRVNLQTISKEQNGVFVSSPPHAVMIASGATALIPLGFKYEIQSDCVLELKIRSGLACEGLQIANAPAQLDADFRGEAKAIIYNSSEFNKSILHGERICQMRLTVLDAQEIEQVQSLSETQRGAGGFGSTGKL